MAFGKNKEEVKEEGINATPDMNEEEYKAFQEAKANDPAMAPQELMQALEDIEQEWKIFQTRLATVFDNYKKGASNTVTKKSMSHAKHASMCVRDALKAFGRVIL